MAMAMQQPVSARAAAPARKVRAARRAPRRAAPRPPQMRVCARANRGVAAARLPAAIERPPRAALAASDPESMYHPPPPRTAAGLARRAPRRAARRARHDVGPAGG